MTESITCPQCGRTSYNPNDVRYGYCGACHDYTSAPASDRAPMQPHEYRTYGCDNCGQEGRGPIAWKAAGISTSRGQSLGPLPIGWERYEYSDPFSVVWCSACVRDVLDQLLVEFTRGSR